jgi:hypothetical protein
MLLTVQTPHLLVADIHSQDGTLPQMAHRPTMQVDQPTQWALETTPSTPSGLVTLSLLPTTAMAAGQFRLQQKFAVLRLWLTSPQPLQLELVTHSLLGTLQQTGPAQITQARLH